MFEVKHSADADLEDQGEEGTNRGGKFRVLQCAAPDNLLTSRVA